MLLYSNCESTQSVIFGASLGWRPKDARILAELLENKSSSSPTSTPPSIQHADVSESSRVQIALLNHCGGALSMGYCNNIYFLATFISFCGSGVCVWYLYLKACLMSKKHWKQPGSAWDTKCATVRLWKGFIYLKTHSFIHHVATSEFLVTPSCFIHNCKHVS